MVVASDLPRARETAALLHPGTEIRTTPLLREMDIPAPTLGRARLPLWAWGLVAYTRFSLGVRAIHAARDAARARAEEAARWLAELAAERGGVVAVTHGAFRPFLADALVARGWRPADRRRRSFAHWSAWTLAPGTRETASPPPPASTPAGGASPPTHRRA